MRLLPHPLSLANYQQIIEVMGRPHNAQVTKLLIEFFIIQQNYDKHLYEMQNTQNMTHFLNMLELQML